MQNIDNLMGKFQSKKIKNSPTQEMTKPNKLKLKRLREKSIKKNINKE